MNVLIVDDSKVVRHVLTATIIRYFVPPKWNDLNIYDANDGDIAISVMKREKIDIVFLDWNMPKMKGDAVVEAIRSNKQWNKTRIVMATTEGSKSSVLAMIKKGANGYIVKPFQEDAVFNALDKLTSRMN